MSEYHETKRIVEEVPIKRARPVVETQYGSVVHEQRGMSGGAVAALVLAALAFGVVITMLILNNQRATDEELAQQAARNAAAEQANAQPSQQPPVVVMPPQSQPGVLPVPVPAPSQPVPVTTPGPTSTELEVEVTSKFLDDPQLRPHSIMVKVSGGAAMLSGEVPNDELKTRAEDLAKSVKGIRSVLNGIQVKST